ncbi:hypothetical protein MLD38_039455 [Melastoma candidum]|uniref:Uncharacterized protein n=1 Tax=Melastoma candidum TaxID=119954 RepID=A0ACB9L3I7_9MYRT|nr:hypothetical protein MLD38_039455 [Melastoma candidum]
MKRSNLLVRSPPPSRHPNCRRYSSSGDTPLRPKCLASLVRRSTAETIPKILRSRPATDFTPSLASETLKLLWNDSQKSLLLFESLVATHPTSLSLASFNLAIDVAARSRQFSAVTSMICRMRSMGINPTLRTFSIVMERYVLAGKPERAIKVFTFMHEYGCPQDLHAFNTLLDVLCKAKRVEMAWDRVFKVFARRFAADRVSYNIIANGWCLVKRVGKALEILKVMLRKGIEPSSSTYNVVLKGFFRAGQVEEGWKFFLEMKKRKCGVDIVSYTTVVHGLGVAGEVGRAQKVFDEMAKVGILPSVATYNALIQVLCKKDSVKNAISVFNEMRRKGYTPNVTTYNLLIRGLCHAGHRDRAMEYMESMKKEDCDDNTQDDGDGSRPNVQTYNLLIRYFCDAGEIERAMSSFEEMNRGDYCLPNLDTYNILISSMFVRKRSEDLIVAGKLLVEMVERGFRPRRFAFNRVLNGLLLTGNQGFAQEILRMQSKFSHLPRQFKL